MVADSRKASSTSSKCILSFKYVVNSGSCSLPPIQVVHEISMITVLSRDKAISGVTRFSKIGFVYRFNGISP